MLPDVATIKNAWVSSWKKALWQASVKLLKGLKKYHHDVAASLTRQINDIDPGLRIRRDYDRSLFVINRIVESMTNHLHQQKKKEFQKLTKDNKQK